LIVVFSVHCISLPFLTSQNFAITFPNFSEEVLLFCGLMVRRRNEEEGEWRARLMGMEERPEGMQDGGSV
jgi:hypothetical protein